MPETRKWAYGLTADEWLHLACEGDKSEIQPCCGNIGHIRDILMALTTVQGEYDNAMRQSLAKMLYQALEADGSGHGLDNRDTFPLLYRVLDGLRAEA